MGVSKAEVNLKRLLRAQVNQTNEAKLVHYVATMRSLLADLTGDPAHQELATIPASRAREYAQQIDLVAQKVRSRGIAEDDHVQAQVVDDMSTWKPSTGAEFSRDSGGDFGRDSAHLSRVDESSYVPEAGAQGPGMTTMRRRLRGDDAKSGNSGLGQPSRAPVRVDASLQSMVQRHRQLQEGLTDEMVTLSAQLKESSLLMDQALHETDKVLESTEDGVEYSLASTNRANVRMGALSSQSWKTSCLTWLLLFMVFGMFMFMVVLIRITHAGSKADNKLLEILKRKAGDVLTRIPKLSQQTLAVSQQPTLSASLTTPTGLRTAELSNFYSGTVNLCETVFEDKDDEIEYKLSYAFLAL